ncbi:hypothetical protein [Bacillus pumilus]|uniref:hypothetical protein n=1 Tax=Bacillus pumilus TaxID=1408 RepID=UPI003F5669C7
MSNKIKWIKVSVYEIKTPKLNIQEDQYIENRFDKEHFLNFLIKIASSKEKIFDVDNKFLTLEEFSVSDDAEFYVGKFTSARYGNVEQLVHRKTLGRRPSNKTVDEGDENTVYFVVDVTNGNLYLQSDSQRIVTKGSIDVYLRSFLELFEKEINEFNRKSNLTITPKNLFNIKTVYSQSFFDEINSLLRIKKATMKVNYNKDINSSVINAIRNGAEEIENADEITYSLSNKERGGSMKKVEKFIKNLEELDKYNNIMVEGVGESGHPRAIKLEDHPQSFYVKVNINSKGLINFNDLINGIVKKGKKIRLRS